jgi:hypothetical protein
MTVQSRYIYALSFIIAAAGFLLPFWPLIIMGICIAALSGRYLFAIAIAILLDIGSGTPTGIWRYLYMPFTVLAVIAALVRVVGARYFLDKTPPDTL